MNIELVNQTYLGFRLLSQTVIGSFHKFNFIGFKFTDLLKKEVNKLITYKDNNYYLP